MNCFINITFEILTIRILARQHRFCKCIQKSEENILLLASLQIGNININNINSGVFVGCLTLAGPEHVRISIVVPTQVDKNAR